MDKILILYYLLLIAHEIDEDIKLFYDITIYIFILLWIRIRNLNLKWSQHSQLISININNKPSKISFSFNQIIHNPIERALMMINFSNSVNNTWSINYLKRKSYSDVSDKFLARPHHRKTISEDHRAYLTATVVNLRWNNKRNFWRAAKQRKNN